MKFVLPGQNATVLAKAIQSFSRIGTELYVEGQPDGFSIGTVNASSSAYVRLLLCPTFFSEFTLSQPAASQQTQDNEYQNKCKLSIKSLLGVFKSMKQVEDCIISLNLETSKLVIKFKCKLETTKIHSISILEYETLKPVCISETFANNLTATHQLLVDIVANFQSKVEELTFIATENELKIKNYLDSSTIDRRFMRSEMTIRPDEFEQYSITSETTITFSLREVRSMLHFAESLNMNLFIKFSTTGKPAIFILKNLDLFEATLVMSTLSLDDTIYDRGTTYNTTIATIKRSNKRKSCQINDDDNDDDNNDDGDNHDPDIIVNVDDDDILTVIDSDSETPSLAVLQQIKRTDRTTLTIATTTVTRTTTLVTTTTTSKNTTNNDTIMNKTIQSVNLNVADDYNDPEQDTDANLFTGISLNFNRLPILSSTRLIPITKTTETTTISTTANTTTTTTTTTSATSTVSSKLTNSERKSDEKTESNDLRVIFEDESDDIMINFEDSDVDSDRRDFRKDNEINRKMKHIFRRCFRLSTDADTILDNQVILVENSDPDDCSDLD